MIIKNVTVVGANGTMGSNASAMFASFGNAKVYMISRDIQKSRNAAEKAIKAVRAESIRKNLIPGDYSLLEEAVKKSDLVFECISENLNLKKEITALIGKYAKKDTIISTGTSGLSINEIASVLPLELRSNYYGIHFFNPPYSMPLVELVPTTHPKGIYELKEYLEDVLVRTVVICKDSPAFVANRIGFEFINLALQFAETYKDKGGIAYIDYVLGTYTGRSMPPCLTADFVGLDVHKAIVDNVFQSSDDENKESFKLPSYIEQLIVEGHLGQKTSTGLYRMIMDNNGKKIKQVFDISSGTYINIPSFASGFIQNLNAAIQNGDYDIALDLIKTDSSLEAEICRKFLNQYIDYSIKIAKECSESIEQVDDAMATGFNWCPPLVLSNALFGTDYPTHYNYKKFFKAVK